MFFVRKYFFCVIALFVRNNCLAFASSETKCPSQNADLLKWSDVKTWNGSFPKAGEDVTISKPILLDLETPRLGKVTIASGGVLVFSPDVALAKLTTIQIFINGELWIGSEDCLFTGNAEIYLIGKYIAGNDNSYFGQKFIGVTDGGTLEMHGKEKFHWSKLTATLSPDSSSEVLLNLLDDVSSWEPNDTIVVASSSYEWREAEVLTVISCPSCSPNQVMVKGPIKNTHLGETVNGIDMRTEVGLLTRNIKIHGEMENSCYGNMKCEEFNYDTFGGHIRILKGFKNVHVEGCELYDMGQQTFIGCYPLHFHMDEEVGNYSFPPYFRSNSIHNSYSRCVVVHGTFGVTVSNHTAYDTLGHCYYMEDGGEKNTTIENNLAIGTRNASLVPSDATDVASFFISLPMTFVRNNVAAGSDGHGLFYIFPLAPVALSANLGFLQTNQSMHTAIYQFHNNVAHSNAKIGLYFDHILGTNHQVLMVSNDYDPVQDPLNFSSTPTGIFLNGFTGYKNAKVDAWVRSSATNFSNFMLTDSKEKLVELSSAPGKKYVTNSIID